MIALLEEYIAAEREFRQILAEMELISYGRTQSFNTSGGGKGENDDPMPTGESWPMHQQWRSLWMRCKPRDRPELVRDARTDLEAWRIRCVIVNDTDYGETDLILDQGKGRSVEDVARTFNTTPTRVRRLRLRANRDSEFGMPADLPEKGARIPGAEERVANLAAQGCTLRQITMQTGVPKDTVRRMMLKQAA